MRVTDLYGVIFLVFLDYTLSYFLLFPTIINIDENELTPITRDVNVEIRKQYETQIAELESDTNQLKDNINEQDEVIARLKQQIAELESRQPVVERVVETVVEGAATAPNEVWSFFYNDFFQRIIPLCLRILCFI